MMERIIARTENRKKRRGGSGYKDMRGLILQMLNVVVVAAVRHLRGDSRKRLVSLECCRGRK